MAVNWWIVAGGVAAYAGLLVAANRFVARQENKLLEGPEGLPEKLPALKPRAKHLLKSIKEGNDRVFASDAQPPGWKELVKNGYVREVPNSDRAELTELGTDVAGMLGTVDEKLIQRVANMQSYDMNKLTIRDKLVDEGYSDQDVYLAYKAAEIYGDHNEVMTSGERKVMEQGLKAKGYLKGANVKKKVLTGLPDASDGEWSVVEDAIREHRLNEAAAVWGDIYRTHGYVTAPQSVWDGVLELPMQDQFDLHDLVSKEKPPSAAFVNASFDAIVEGGRRPKKALKGALASPESDEAWSPAKDALIEYDQLKSTDAARARVKIKQAKTIIESAQAAYPNEPQPEWFTKWKKKQNEPKFTYPEARSNIFKELTNHRWALSSTSLKIPHATSPDGKIRLWFKPQAVWMSTVEHHGQRHNYKDAHTISYDLDIRKVDPTKFVRSAEDQFSPRSILKEDQTRSDLEVNNAFLGNI